MGNSSSVNSLIDALYETKAEERLKALNDLIAKNEDVRRYLRATLYENIEPHQQPEVQQAEVQPAEFQPAEVQQPQSKRSWPKTLRTRGIVPTQQNVSKYDLWLKNLDEFWKTSTFTFMPPKGCHKPLHFVYDKTIQKELETHNDCLRARYLALFWFDYSKVRYPKHERVFDSEYADLGRELGPSAEDNKSTAARLRELVSAGKRYNMLTSNFGDGILLAIPASVGKSTLETKLPLNKDDFEKWAARLIKEDWIKEAEKLRRLGAKIRDSLLKICFDNPRNDQTTSSLLKKRKTDVKPNPPLNPTPLEAYSTGNQYLCEYQQKEGVYQNAYCAATIGNISHYRTIPNELETFSGDLMLPDVGVDGWGNCDNDVFRPTPFHFEAVPETFQPQHFQEDGGESVFLPQPFGFMS